MDEAISLTKALSEQVARLERVLAMNIKVGDKPPGESQITIIKAQIAELKREIGNG